MLSNIRARYIGSAGISAFSAAWQLGKHVPTPAALQAMIAPPEVAGEAALPASAVLRVLEFCHDTKARWPVGLSWFHHKALFFVTQLLAAAVSHLPPGSDGLAAPLRVLNSLRLACFEAAAARVGGAYAAIAFPGTALHSACQGLSLLSAAVEAAPRHSSVGTSCFSAAGAGIASPAAPSAAALLPLLTPLEACAAWLEQSMVAEVNEMRLVAGYRQVSHGC